MQQSSTNYASGRPTLRMAGPYILAFGVLQVLFVLVGAFTPGFGLLWSILNLVLSIALFMYAGYHAARMTGKTSTGAMVGLWTGVFGGLIGFVASLIQIILSPEAMRQAAQTVYQQYQQSSATQNISASTVQTIVFWTAVFMIVLGWVFAIALGSGTGAIGGAIGRSKANTPVNETPAYENVRSSEPPRTEPPM